MLAACLGTRQWACALLVAITPLGAEAGAAYQDPALGLSYVLPAAPSALTAEAAPSPAGHRLSRGIEAAGVSGLIELGVKASKEALLECQKGDYPGGGMGLLSMPLARPNAVTDHCRRF